MHVEFQIVVFILQIGILMITMGGIFYLDYIFKKMLREIDKRISDI